MESCKSANDHPEVESKQTADLTENNEVDVPTLEVVEATTLIEIQGAKSEGTKQQKTNEPLTVPYILNGELYEILSRNGENVTVKCCSCPSGRFYRGSVRSTGNFHMHIKRRHPYLLGKLHDMKVHSLLERRDRLMKNRKAKLRRILVNNNGTRGDHEQHNLKIKRAFQRHQAEAKGNEKNALSETRSRGLRNESSHFQEMPAEAYTESNQSSNFIEQSSNLPLKAQKFAATECSLVGTSSENVCCELRLLNATQSISSNTLVPTQQSTPVASPYRRSYESNTLSEYNASTYANLKGESYYVECPLDLSRGTRSSSPSVNISYGSSGIGLEPMWSNTTVANTNSTSISIEELGSHNSSQSDCGDAIWWQQRLVFILRDIHNDIRARNRIEHNRLLLEVEKLKFLHPGFYFNLQD